MNDEKRKDACPKESMHPLMMKLYGLMGEMNETIKSHEGIILETMQNDIDAELNILVESCERMLDSIRKIPGKFLHNKVRLHNTDVIKTVIKAFPEALLQENDKGELPIQSTAGVFCTRFIPILALEAKRQNIDLDRGGLLLPHPIFPNCNILQQLIMCGDDDEEKSSWFQHIWREFKCTGLLFERDYIEYDLLRFTCFETRLEQLDCLIDLYPTTLSKPAFKGNFPIHPDNYDHQSSIEVFTRLLKAGMKYYPETFGFLFRRNGEGGERAITRAIAVYGKKETLQTIQYIIPPNEEYAILHYVFRFTPHLSEDFIYRYPDAMYLKDRHGRQLLHVALKRGLKLSAPLFMMIHSNKASIEEGDPVTNLYPFMLAATGKEVDLTTIYKLLTLRPEVISKCFDDCDGDGDGDGDVDGTQ